MPELLRRRKENIFVFQRDRRKLLAVRLRFGRKMPCGGQVVLLIRSLRIASKEKTQINKIEEEKENSEKNIAAFLGTYKISRR
jgi:hypothetical protein